MITDFIAGVMTLDQMPVTKLMKHGFVCGNRKGLCLIIYYIYIKHKNSIGALLPCVYHCLHAQYILGKAAVLDLTHDLLTS